MDKIHVTEFRAKLRKRAPKYRNVKIVYEGEKFDSKRELEHYKKLKLRQQLGEISELTRQVEFTLIPAKYEHYEVKGKRKTTTKKRIIERQVVYKADFSYMQNGERVVVDAKGMRTKDYNIKRKLMLHVHGIRKVEV